MKYFSPEELSYLLEEYNDPCISIYLPTFVKGNEVEQNQIRFKNLLQKTGDTLEEYGFRKPQIDEILAPLMELLEDAPFWSHQKHGLALFRTPDNMRVYRAPIEFQEISMVAPRFFIKPLIPLINENEQYGILALDLKQIKLYSASRYHIEEWPLQDVPQSIEEILKYDDPEKQLQFHTGTGQSSDGKRAAMFHGRGTGSDKAGQKKNILRFFLAVSDKLDARFRQDNLPIILAGVDYLHSIYRQASSYTHFIKKGIHADTDDLSLDELHEKSWNIMEPHYKVGKERILGIYEQLKDKNNTGNDLDSLLTAAHMNRIKNLLIQPETQVWGQYDLDNDKVSKTERKGYKDVDLVDLLVAQTLLQNGDVMILNKENMPDAPVAAIYRF
jgi:hypothetical protein